ncbi:hypothetical protein J6590_005028 [Homalodisca vitripennis]|nr:hypothetical protein J6590_005028 [Homalodisca vitripennis]
MCEIACVSEDRKHTLLSIWPGVNNGVQREGEGDPKVSHYPARHDAACLHAPRSRDKITPRAAIQPCSNSITTRIT